MLRLVVEQRSDEHDQEQLRIERHFHIAAGNDGDEQPDGDLDERQGDAGDDLVDKRGRQHGGKQKQAEGQGFHEHPLFREADAEIAAALLQIVISHRGHVLAHLGIARSRTLKSLNLARTASVIVESMMPSAPASATNSRM